MLNKGRKIRILLETKIDRITGKVSMLGLLKCRSIRSGLGALRVLESIKVYLFIVVLETFVGGDCSGN
jgi:hypothetical protein